MPDSRDGVRVPPDPAQTTLRHIIFRAANQFSVTPPYVAELIVDAITAPEHREAVLRELGMERVGAERWDLWLAPEATQ